MALEDAAVDLPQIPVVAAATVALEGPAKRGGHKEEEK